MFHKVEEILEELKKGKFIIVVDDESRENEGDLVLAASFAEPEKINFMIKEARGLVCVSMEKERLDTLGLHPMVPSSYYLEHNVKDPYGTAWAMSVDARTGTTTGISTYDRAMTIKVLIDPQTKPPDLIKPGHLFPLQAKEGGVMVRAGHTEASIDLMKLAGLYPAAVICEIINDDGTMSRLPQLKEFAKKHELKICSIKDLIGYRRKKEKLIEFVGEATLPTRYGKFKMKVYESTVDDTLGVALIKGGVSDGEPVLVRVHSSCLTGDVFMSLRCDCGEQLQHSLQMIGDADRGILLYLTQEGRGIGLVNKIKAYNLQEQGLDTVEANIALGFPDDLRDYGIGAQILADLGVRNIKLITNNPRKVVGLEGYGIKITERVPVQIKPCEHNVNYLKAKSQKMGHLIDILLESQKKEDKDE